VSAIDRISGGLFPRKVVALRVVGAAAMRRLNRDFRGVDEPTDVLSFPADGAWPHSHAGDIALCWDSVVRQAAANGNPVEAEAVALVAHGLLHLAGWEHADDDSQRAMNAQVHKLLKVAGIEVHSFGH
jgi:probable rRNA maturation factor